MSATQLPRTFVAAETETAAYLNSLGSIIAGMMSAWTPFTPTWTAATTNPVLGNGTLVGRSLQIGKTVYWWVRVVGGSSTTWGSGGYLWNLPIAPLNGTGSTMGSGLVANTSAGFYGRTAVCVGSNTVALVDAAAARVGQGTPVTFASGYAIDMQGMYEAA